MKRQLVSDVEKHRFCGRVPEPIFSGSIHSFDHCGASAGSGDGIPFHAHDFPQLLIEL